MEELKPGMTVQVHQKIKETNSKGEEKERIQVFEGMILSMRGKGVSKTMTVRKIASGVGVEKIFPLNLPSIEKIVPVKQAAVRKSKLYYLREKRKKRLKETSLMESASEKARRVRKEKADAKAARKEKAQTEEAKA